MLLRGKGWKPLDWNRRCGLGQYKDGKLRTFTTDGLSSNSAVALYEDSIESCGSGLRAGLNRIENGKFFQYTVKRIVR